MEFKTFGELIQILNSSLGDFCDEFARKRVELAELDRIHRRGQLFSYKSSSSNNWAINSGGGTEVQYHIELEPEDLTLTYGLGFNTKYVPFASNKRSMIDIMQPFINGFLLHKDKLVNLLPDYNIVIGSLDQLKNPEIDQYTLFGKSVNISSIDNRYIIDEQTLNEICQDLKRQFEPYQIIFREAKNQNKFSLANQNLLNILEYKGQIILQGPPGTGKTYTAKDLAEQLIFGKISTDKKEQKNLLGSSEQFKLIQFHPAYSYEDFVRGIVAEANDEGSITYSVKDKILSDFAKNACDSIENLPYVLIIDEINRANLPSVLGELIYALEYRDETVESMYAINEEHSIVIPSNLYIIGTMNTSDRSVSHIDYAIRRRFAFVDVLPKVLPMENFNVDSFKAISELFIKNFDEYVQNNNIELKKSDYLSEEFKPETFWLGHSYFIEPDGLDFALRMKYEIMPILKEYVKDGILKETALKYIDNL